MSDKLINILNCKGLKNFDLFSKTPEIYYKGRSQRSAFIGRLLTIIYILLYASFFIYKVIMMSLKVEISFYETQIFMGEIPSLKLNNDLFYTGFGLVDAETGNTFIDETIYYPELVFRTGKKIDNEWYWEEKYIEIEPCKIEKFGSKFRDMFANKVENLYCLSEMDVTIQGHITYDIYSYFYLVFYPCVNGVNGRSNCQDYEIIKKKLGSTMLTVKMQDVELTPHIYKTPVQPRSRELSTPVMENLYNNINAYFHIINIKTNEDILGFEALTRFDIKKYFKYDVTFISNSINDESPFKTGAAYCNILLQLTEQMITINRTFTKLIEVLGEVGGFMKFTFSCLKIISLLLTEALYEKDLINNLFSFDINKKLINIRPLKKEKNKNYPFNELGPIETIENCNQIDPIAKVYSKNSNTNVEAIRTNNLLNEDLNKNKLARVNTLAVNQQSQIKKRRKKRIKTKKTTISSQITKIGINEENSTKSIKSANDQINKNEKEFDFSERNKETERGKEEEDKRYKINKILFGRFEKYLCFLCLRKKKNIQNILIDEGMKLVSEYLDIINMFKRAFLEEQLFQKYNIKCEKEMSDECKNKIQKIYKSV